MNDGPWAPRASATVLRLAVVAAACAAAMLATAPRTEALLALLANPDMYSVRHDHVLSVGAPGVLGNDVVVGGSTAVRDTQPAHGSLVLQPSGAFSYTPAAGFVGTDSFRYHAHDLLDSNSATVTITVTNATPVARDDSYTATTGVNLSVAAPGLLGNDTDADGDPLTAQLVDAGGNGSLDVNADGSFSFKSGGSFSGDRTFTYRITDAIAWSALATVTIAVSPTATPTPGPTATPAATGTPASTNIPIPTVPIPTLPVPTLPLPSLPSASLPAIATLPPASSLPSPSAPAATPTPAPSSPGTAGGASGPAGTPPDGAPSGGGTGGNRVAPPSGFTIDESFGTFDGLGPMAFESFEWAVPGLALSVPGLLLIVAIAAQAGAGLSSMPFVRRWLGSFGLWRRRDRESESG